MIQEQFLSVVIDPIFVDRKINMVPSLKIHDLFHLLNFVGIFRILIAFMFIFDSFDDV